MLDRSPSRYKKFEAPYIQEVIVAPSTHGISNTNDATASAWQRHVRC